MSTFTFTFTFTGLLSMCFVWGTHISIITRVTQCSMPWMAAATSSQYKLRDLFCVSNVTIPGTSRVLPI